MTFEDGLGELARPESYAQPLVLEGDRAGLIESLRMMILIRVAEEKIGDMVVSGKIRCPCHLGIGQEAVAVGVAHHLRKSDRVFGGHRSHSHYLSQGGSLAALYAEILGKETGCSKGMGGSMHLYDAPNGFIGSVPIVAGTVAIAVGAGLAAKKDGRGDVAVAYFGDGAAEEGAVHESMNFAAAFRVPVLFVCENNLFSSHLHINLRQPSDNVSRFAAAHRIPYEMVDGNDVVAVRNATDRLLERCRRNEAPGFLEAVTYRWRGHVGPSEDNDVGVMRKEGLTLWKRRDPVRRLADALISENEFTAVDLAGMWTEIRRQSELAWEQAEAAPYPLPSALFDRVYANPEARVL